MAETRLSVIVPTCGRSTLAATLRSILGQAEGGDEVVVVGDGPCPAAERTVAHAAAERGGPVLRYVEHPRARNGGRLRNFALDRLVGGTHVAAIDDDDVYLGGALALLREGAREVPTIFRMRYGAAHPAHGLVLWREPRPAFGNVGTPMVVAPAGRARYGVAFASDFVYLRALLAEFGSVRWRPEIIAEIRPAVPKPERVPSRPRARAPRP